MTHCGAVGGSCFELLPGDVPEPRRSSAGLLAVFCTGLGAANPGVAAGAAPPCQFCPSKPAWKRWWTRHCSPTRRMHFFLGFTGLYQVNFELEGDEAPGTGCSTLSPAAGPQKARVFFPVRVIKGAPVAPLTSRFSPSRRAARPRPPAAASCLTGVRSSRGAGMGAPKEIVTRHRRRGRVWKKRRSPAGRLQVYRDDGNSGAAGELFQAALERRLLAGPGHGAPSAKTQSTSPR